MDAITFGNFLKCILLYAAAVFGSATLAYVVSYCAVRGAFDGFMKSITETTKPKSEER